jgi:hypothetical protein
MTATQPGKPFYESVGFKMVVAIAIILFFVAVYLVQTRQGERSDAGTPAKPVQGNSPATTMPAPEGIEPHSEFPADNWQGQTDAASSIPGQATSHDLPVNTPAAVTKTQPLPSSAPQTQVHPLSDAEAVMGPPSSGDTGEVGVTRTYKLPAENGRGKNPTVPVDPQKP